MNNLPDRIIQIRDHFGLTQEKLAVRINKTTGFISNVETGRSGLSDDTIQAFTSIFGINGEWLKNGTGSMFLPGRETEKTDSSGIGDRVRKIRTREGLSQNQLAEITNYNKKHIYNIEKGRCKPSDALVNKLCAEFNVSFDWLMYGGRRHGSRTR